MQTYLPTLPDPYAANIEQLKFQFRGSDQRSLYLVNQAYIWLLLICRVRWEPVALEEDQVEVSFHFAPLPNQPPWTDNGPANDLDFIALAGGDPNAGVEPQSQVPPIDVTRSPPPPPDYGDIWERSVAGLQVDQFALLDVSTNADLLGVSFGSIGTARLAMRTTLLPAESGFPLQVRGMEVVSRGMNVRAFTAADFLGTGHQSHASGPEQA
jgi:hypothetical protein